MTTPAQDAPLVFPSVAFRPIRLLVISVALTAVAIVAAGSLGHPMVGVFFGIGLLMGLLNALGVRRSVAVITADAHPLKKKMALNSAGRLLVISVIALVVAFVFRPQGLGVVFGLALFQVLLVFSTALPIWQKLRTGTAELGPDGAGTDGRADSDG
ncbi:MAG: ATP synthase subunit I [Mycobacterium sp.]